jgi:tRNA nucleotidyltransferase (CCA-adding enzyme)
MSATVAEGLEVSILDEILPTTSEKARIERTADELRKLVRDAGENIRPGLEYMLVGSVAKGTYLKDPDIDIFIIFPGEVPRAELELVGLEIGEASIGGVRKYAEHPYIHGQFKGFDVDIVPCYRISDGERNLSAVDRTPLHTIYIQTHLSKEMGNEVALLKRFAKGIGCYGADGRVQGFSGYLVELLVLRFGSFDEVLRASADWRHGVRLSIGPPGSMRFTTPMVFIDPVDLRRNVASAVSTRSLATFCYAARSYLDEPSRAFFFPYDRKTMSMEQISAEIERRGSDFCVVHLPRPDIIDDNLYPQVRRTQEGVVSLCMDKGFDVLDSSFDVGENDISIVIEVASDILSNAHLHRGPPALNENSVDFIRKWRRCGISGPFILDGRWVVLAPREFPYLADMLMENLHLAAMGSDLRNVEGVRIIGGAEVLTAGLEGPLSRHLDKRMSWQA